VWSFIYYNCIRSGRGETFRDVDRALSAAGLNVDRALSSAGRKIDRALSVTCKVFHLQVCAEGVVHREGSVLPVLFASE
jgi:hypothetical protein